MNFRRIFEERAYDIRGRILPLADMRLCRDMPSGMTVCADYHAFFIAKAEPLLGKKITPLTATDYMIYRHSGNRGIFEGKYFERRADLMTLAYAEVCEGNGRFTDAIIDRLWAILEETTWVLPAHNRALPEQSGLLSYAFAEKVDYIDLFAASTAADIAVVAYLLKGTLDAVSELLYERIVYEVNRRAITPFLDQDLLHTTLWWSGIREGTINNWCPWIISNLLTACALTVQDMPIREAVTAQSMWLLNNFTAGYHDDGGCDEGPGYWGVSCASLYDCCCLLYDISGGYVNMFDDVLLRRMGEYRCAVYVAGGKSLNFADASPLAPLGAATALDWGHRIGSPTMITYGRRFLCDTPDVGNGYSTPYRNLRLCRMPKEPKQDFTAKKQCYLNGLQIAVTRETSKEDEGLYLAFKGGHNGESHNHCDVGQIIVFSDGDALFLDPGVCNYTARTFGAQRYTIWSMRSDYHNTATVNGCLQSVGGCARAKPMSYDENTGKLTLDLTDVYPEDARLSSYVRSAVLQNGTVTVTDTLTFDGEGMVDFHFIVTEQPTDVTENSLRLQGCTVNFDEILRVEVEACDHSQPETATLGRAWGTDTLYRITLRAAPFAAHTFTLTIHK